MAIYGIKVYNASGKKVKEYTPQEAEELYYKDVVDTKVFRRPDPKGRLINCRYCGDTVKVFQSKAIKCKKINCKVAHQREKRKKEREREKLRKGNK